jgi:FAD:protein FMN transferase
MQKKTYIIKTALTLLIILVILWQGIRQFRRMRDAGKTAPTTFSCLVMDTYAKITILGLEDSLKQDCIAAAQAKLREMESRFSYYIPESELSRINSTPANTQIRLSDEMFSLIEQSMETYKDTGGTFDITLGAIGDLWKQSAGSGTKPSSGQLTEARERTGMDKLILDPENKTLTFLARGVKIDLGGIAKGYAIDKVYDIISEYGVSGGIIDIGGDMRVFGQAQGGKNWIIGIQDPFFAAEHGTDSAPRILKKMVITDTAIATSGHYRRFTAFGDERISHIIDPALTAGANKTASVTVLAPTAAEADALATAVSVMGGKKGLELINSLEGIEAIIIESNSADILYSRGAKQFIAE